MTSEQEAFNPPRLLDASGRPARRAQFDDGRCPKCGAGKGQRMKAGGFGDPPVICGACGLEFPRGTEC